MAQVAVGDVVAKLESCDLLLFAMMLIHEDETWVSYGGKEDA